MKKSLNIILFMCIPKAISSLMFAFNFYQRKQTPVFRPRMYRKSLARRMRLMEEETIHKSSIKKNYFSNTLYLNWKYSFRDALLICILEYKEYINNFDTLIGSSYRLYWFVQLFILERVSTVKISSKRFDDCEDAKLDLLFVNTHGMKN